MLRQHTFLMLLEKLKELESLREKTAALEMHVAAERNKELAALPAQYGFDNVDAFIAALNAATGKKRGRPARVTRGTKNTSSSTKGRRRRRATITDEMREEVKKSVATGKSGAEIAKALRISLPSVQNIKKALGLVNARKK